MDAGVNLIVGLGNPGDVYLWTRHNAGFLIIDSLAARLTSSDRPSFHKKYDALACTIAQGEKRLVLIKPQTFMNLSGRAVRRFADFYKASAHDIIVVHDDMDLEFGRLKVKRGGGEAGHNGLLSVTEHLGSGDYVRLRFGIGRPPSRTSPSADGADYVLSPWSRSERKSLEGHLSCALDAVLLVLDEGVEKAMNSVNMREKE